MDRGGAPSRGSAAAGGGSAGARGAVRRPGRVARSDGAVCATGARPCRDGCAVSDRTARGHRPRHQAAAPHRRDRAADRHLVRQRGPARAPRGAAGGRSGDPRGGGAGWWIRAARPAGTHRPRDFPPCPQVAPAAALSRGERQCGDARAQGGGLRGPSRSRHRHLSWHADDPRRRGGGDARGGGGRVRGRVATERAPVPVGSARAIPGGGGRRRTRAPVAPAGQHDMAAAARQDACRDPSDGAGAARPLRPAAGRGGLRVPHRYTVAARAGIRFPL